MKTLLILNDAPYGSERTYNGARLAGSLAKPWRRGPSPAGVFRHDTERPADRDGRDGPAP